jgi:hypothetical protein
MLLGERNGTSEEMMKYTDLLIKALRVNLQRERRHPNATESLAFRSQYYTDTLPLDLQAHKARAVEKARSLPDSDYETDGFANPEMCHTDRDRVLIWLMAYAEEAERRDIPDPEDWGQALCQYRMRYSRTGMRRRTTS